MNQGAWILIGMMGCGKSAVGRRLAEWTGRPFLDTDAVLQHKIGRPVRQMFDLYGEESFREFETKVLAELKFEPSVISTGGGIVLRDANWEQLQRLGDTIYLRAQADTLINRLTMSRNKRPLLMVDNWEDKLREILAARTQRYEMANHIVDVDDLSIESVSEAVLKVLKQERPHE